jgi:hypothetical protein
MIKDRINDNGKQEIKSHVMEENFKTSYGYYMSNLYRTPHGYFMNTQK